MKTIAMLLFLLFSGAVTADESPKWSIEKLNGVIGYHSGANCFNGALAALGYTDYLVHTDHAEFNFYKNLFCTKQERAPEHGEIVEIPGHVGIYLDDQHVFEKGGFFGFFRYRWGNQETSTYQVVSPSESYEFRKCKSPECAGEVYSCDPASQVRAKMVACHQRLTNLGMNAILADFSSITLDRSEKVRLKDSTAKALIEFSESLGELDMQDDCSIYVLSVTDSIRFYVAWILLQGLGPPSYFEFEYDNSLWQEANQAMTKKLASAKKRAAQINTDPRMRDVISALIGPN